ncbi:hypothetical protein ACFL6Y_09625 [Elusimicrobiota bacterium]
MWRITPKILRRKKVKERKRFVPRTGNFTGMDVIDHVRVADPTGAYFGWLDANVLHKLNDIAQEEYLLYCFYCHAAALDKSHQGLSDYGLSQIQVALKMSVRIIIRARENLAKKHHLIAYRRIKNSDGGERAVVQVLSLQQDDIIVIRRRKRAAMETPPAALPTNRSFSRKQRVFPREGRDFSREGGDFPGEGGVFPREGLYPQGIPQGRPFSTENNTDINVVDRRDIKNVNVFNNQESLADDILEELGDKQSEGYYRKLARVLPERIIRDALGDAKYAWLSGKVRTTKAQYFTDLVKRYAREAEIEI